MTLISMLMLVLLSLGSSLSQETYSDKYDNINVDLILNNDRLLNRYMACILDNGSCSPDGRYFQSILPDALETNCSKCTDKMKTNIKKVSNHLRKRRPEDWAKFVQKYDADSKYRHAFEQFLSE